MSKQIAGVMVKCPACERSWPDVSDNAHCIIIHGRCLQCRYEKKECVTLELEFEAGLNDGVPV